jgi:hypothetical protein
MLYLNLGILNSLSSVSTFPNTHFLTFIMPTLVSLINLNAIATEIPAVPTMFPTTSYHSYRISVVPLQSLPSYQLLDQQRCYCEPHEIKNVANYTQYTRMGEFGRSGVPDGRQNTMLGSRAGDQHRTKASRKYSRLYCQLLLVSVRRV